MRLIIAITLLGVVAFASAGDPSHGNPISGVTGCILPASRLQCIRDWRSGFVAGVKLGYEGITSAASGGNQKFLQVCSAGIQNQTLFDMSVKTTTGSIASANNAAPSWYKANATELNQYFYPAGAYITQMIVLHAPNPFGNKFGTIPAIIFVYKTAVNETGTAVCGNAKYAAFYLNPSDANPPPTPVTLKAVFNSPLSEEGNSTALGSFEAKCAVRGTSFVSYHGGDPWKSSKYFIKAVKKACFAPIATLQTPDNSKPPADFNLTTTDFTCGNNTAEKPCFKPCHYDKKQGKKSTSYSCVAAGNGIATGKYGAIVFDKEGEVYEWDKDEQGKYKPKKYEGDLQSLPEGDFEVEGYDEEESA